MKRKSNTYQNLLRIVAVLLVAGMLLPTGLQAKQLMDFCMMEMSHHEIMDASHDCCISDQTDHEATHKSHQDCEDTQICACTVDTTLAKNQFRVPTLKSSAVILSQTGFNFMVRSPDEFIYKEHLAFAGGSYPPLYLLYDTFLN